MDLVGSSDIFLAPNHVRSSVHVTELPPLFGTEAKPQQFCLKQFLSSGEEIFHEITVMLSKIDANTEIIWSQV